MKPRCFHPSRRGQEAAPLRDERNCAHAGMRPAGAYGSLPPSLVAPQNFARFMPECGFMISSQQKTTGEIMTNPIHLDNKAEATSVVVGRRDMLRGAAAIAATALVA